MTLSNAVSKPANRHLYAVAYHPKQGLHEHIEPEAVDRSLANDSLIWLDITAPRPEDAAMLQEEFGLHPLALEELSSSHPRPKCAEYPGQYVMVMFAADPYTPGRVNLRDVVIYLGRNFIVTAHDEPFPEIDECVRRWEANTALQKDTIAAPLYSLLDTLVDGYFPLIDQLAEQVEDVEDRMLTGEPHAMGASLFSLKKELLVLRRIVSGERDALNLLLRQDVPLFPETSSLYFQSVYDHLVRLVESIDTYRDLLSSAMDMHLSVVSNRLNQVMKTMTGLATILMSAALITGIYGMNFKHMPELESPYGYPAAIGAMVGVAGGLAWYFRRIKWL
jgi:magnesium transporter